MNRSTCLLVGIALAVAGCATGSFVIDRPAQQPNRPNSLVVDKSRDAVWEAAIAGLGKRFFVINNLDRASGFISLSYNGPPLRYVDCGIMRIEAKTLMGEFRQNIPAATESAEYPFVAPDATPMRVRRAMKLEGRINVIVQAQGASQTSLVVNARYILNRSAEFFDSSGRRVGSAADSQTMDTGGTANFQGSSAMQCVPTGLLEEDVLNALVGR